MTLIIICESLPNSSTYYAVAISAMRRWQVAKVPHPEVGQPFYSITSSARISMSVGTVMPSCAAVLRLTNR